MTTRHILNSEKSHILHKDKKIDLPLQPADEYLCAHLGTSMNPTLSKRDILGIKPYNDKRPQIGDVVLFQVSHYDNYVIHRIIQINPDGFKTKGDNSDIADPWVLQKENILGRIIAAQQGNKRRKIASGFIGRLTGISCLARQKTNKLLIKLLGPVYRSLCTGGFLHWLIPVQLTPQVATFRSDTNDSHKLLLGKHIIGSYDKSLLQWQIRRPYRLFVDESTLPTPR